MASLLKCSPDLGPIDRWMVEVAVAHPAHQATLAEPPPRSIQTNGVRIDHVFLSNGIY